MTVCGDEEWEECAGVGGVVVVAGDGGGDEGVVGVLV